MRKTLIFDTIVQDTLRLEAGKVIPAGTSFSLFTPDDVETENYVTDEHEEPILKRFMSSRAVDFLFNYLQLPSNSFFAFSVKEPVRKNSNHPDFDLLICESNKPEFTTAIQCKRVKVFAKNEFEDRVTKLNKLKQVVTQANIQRTEYGFHKNYLAIIIETFGKNRVNQNILFRHPTQQTFKDIYEVPERANVHKDVGIIFIKMTQPTGKSYEDKISIGICHDKPAAQLSQSDDLTNRIKDFVNSCK